MIIFVPYELEVPMPRWPWANFLLMGASIIIFIGEVFQFIPEPLIDDMILDHWNASGLFGSMFLHADLFHLAGNMIFLWVFGNAICSRCGNIIFTLLYLSTGLVAGATHLLIDGGPAVGASGAINGIIGAYLLFFPINRIYCFWLIFFRFGTVGVSGYWLILAWFILDVIGSIGNFDGIAYWAHIGGFISGLLFGLLILIFKQVELERFDNPHLGNYLLPAVFGKHHHPDLNAETSPVIPPVNPTYYIHIDGTQYGPYEIAAIRQYLASGELSDDHYIFDPVFNDWRLLKDFFM